MGTQLEAHTDADDLTFERFRAAIAGDRGYPSGAAFIDAEAHFAQAAILRNIREGRPVVVIFPDGQEKVVKPVNPGGFLASFPLITAFTSALERIRGRQLH
jgi:hypothetical protein